MSAMPRERLVGIILLAVAAIMALIAILLGYSSLTRWRAVAAMREYHAARLAKDAATARDAAETAASLMPGDAIFVLPSIDPASPETVEHLERLERKVESRQKPLVRLAKSFAGALQGQQPDGIEGSDGVLLRHLATLTKGDGTIPPFPKLTQGDPPHRAILDQAIQHHLAAGWQSGKATDLKEALEAFVLLSPDHAEIGKAKVILAAIGDGPPAVVGVFLQDAIGKRAPLLRQLSMLKPGEANTFLRLIPESEQSPEEMQRLMIAQGDSGDVTSQVDRALASPSDPVIAMLFKRCLAEDKIELARKLREKAGPGLHTGMDTALAFHLGDLAAVAKLQPDRTDLKPTVTTPIGRDGAIAFHLSTPSGIVPRAALRVLLNNEPVAPERLHRWGSLVLVEFRGTAMSMNVQIQLGKTAIFTGDVRL